MRLRTTIKIAIVCVISFVSLSALGQVKGTIKARIIDEREALIPSGNAYLLRPSDSRVLLSGSWYKGELNFPTDTGTFMLKIVVQGYEDHIQKLENTAKDHILDLGTIRLKPKSIQLQEVNITSKPPVLSTSQGNTKIDIANSTLSSSSTIEELFSKLPGVVLDGQNASVVGKGEAIIYYNGDRITAEQLRAIPVERIKKISVVTNPSSKYDAQGNAVIDIEGKQNFSQGLLGEFRQIVQAGRFFNETTNLSMDYKANRLSISGGYTQNTLNRDVRVFSNYNHVGDKSFNGDALINTHIRSAFIPTYRLGTSYEISSHDLVSFEYKGNNTREHQDVANHSNTYSSNDPLNQNVMVNNQGRTQWYNNSASLNYSHRLDSMGSRFLFAGQYFNEHEHDNYLIQQDGTAQNTENFSNENRDIVKIYSVRADFNKNFDKVNSVSAGFKFSGTRMNSLGDFNQIDSGKIEPITEFSNNYKFRENITAAYIEYKGGGKSLTYTIGGRLEHTATSGRSVLQNRSIIDTNYLNVYPNLHVAYKKNDLELGLDYSRRILRPSYDDLSPYVLYNGPTNIVKGSPTLTPAYTQSVSAYFQIKDYVVKAGYSKTRGEINTIAEFGEIGEVLLQKLNLARHSTYFLNLTIPVKVGNWTSENNFNISYDRLSDSRFTRSLYSYKPLYYIYSYNNYVIPKLFSLDLLVNYSSSQANGLARTKDQLYTEIGISKKYLGKKLTIRLSGLDLFNSYTLNKSLSYNDSSYGVDRNVTLRSVKLSASLRFGKLKSTNYSNKAAAEDETDRAH
ncbi:hypothetical protein FHW88_005284 [Mucilaginibacter sp. SG538B]|uniref:outer membrane beta-barrel family protein n=1 Tax=Mucilaginibacter sp. SG538B TaxID=2587021 RepID=UPI00159DED7E|nr:outer membrane beta-barrel family protein [Mucilaginibacter sp. SG538B]NVM66966.1 hypothetical protein [Mucilaginibacter sp. SG538B]